MIIGARSELTTIRAAARACALAASQPCLFATTRARGRDTGNDENPTPRVHAARQRFARGTSLARHDNAGPNRIELLDRRAKARVKMLDNEIAFDIPCGVPEYVPPRCGAHAGRHIACARQAFH